MILKITIKKGITMSDHYEDLIDNDSHVTYSRIRIKKCPVCNDTGEVTAMHRKTGYICEFKCACQHGFNKYKNPIDEKTKLPGGGVAIAPEWEKATWIEGRMKAFVKYDPALLPSHNN